MKERIKEILLKYQGQNIEFAVNFEKSGGTLQQQLAKLYEDEMALKLRKDKEAYLSKLENLVLVWNNNVLMSKLADMRKELE